MTSSPVLERTGDDARARVGRVSRMVSRYLPGAASTGPEPGGPTPSDVDPRAADPAFGDGSAADRIDSDPTDSDPAERPRGRYPWKPSWWRGRRRLITGIGGAAALLAGGGAAKVFSVWGGAGEINLLEAVAGAVDSNSLHAGLSVRNDGGAILYPTASEAAAKTRVTVETVLAKDPVRHLASRATFGPTPQVISEIQQYGIDAWIERQLQPQTIPETRGEQRLAELQGYALTPTQLRARDKELSAKGQKPSQENILYAVGKMIWSDRQLFEVMVDFWNDFLHVAAEADGLQYHRASFDRDVVRKFALDNYPDMFVAANRHPALLLYLNQNKSTRRNVNENLARENLELYTVGVNGGYTETDVRQAALLQTGRGVRDDRYVYTARDHFVGPVKILDFAHPNGSAAGGEAVQEAYFRYLAMHPQTARYIATSLAIRFVSDVPQNTLVDRLAQAYLENQGKIAPVLMTLFRSSEFWAAVGQKWRRPMEYLVATYRTVGVQPDTPGSYRNPNGSVSPFVRGLDELRDKLAELGQTPMGQATPNGYPDVFESWSGSATLLAAWNEAMTAVEGGRKMFTYTRPEQLVGASAPGTAGEYLDALTQRLVYQKLSDPERATILSVAGVNPGTKVNAQFNGAIKAIARTVLAAPQHHLR